MHGAEAVQVQAIARQLGIASILEDAGERVLAGLSAVGQVLRTLVLQEIQEE